MESEIRNIIVGLLDKQIEKGVKTYGHTLDLCPDKKYDWMQMALEEAIDLNQYLVKQLLIHKKDSERKESIIMKQAETIRRLAIDEMAAILSEDK